MVQVTRLHEYLQKIISKYKSIMDKLKKNKHMKGVWVYQTSQRWLLVLAQGFS